MHEATKNECVRLYLCYWSDWLLTSHRILVSFLWQNGYCYLSSAVAAKYFKREPSRWRQLGSKDECNSWKSESNVFPSLFWSYKWFIYWENYPTGYWLHFICGRWLNNARVAPFVVIYLCWFSRLLTFVALIDLFLFCFYTEVKPFSFSVRCFHIDSFAPRKWCFSWMIPNCSIS